MRVFLSWNGFRFSMNLGPTTCNEEDFRQVNRKLHKGRGVNEPSLSKRNLDRFLKCGRVMTSSASLWCVHLKIEIMEILMICSTDDFRF
jgi:hypothetical protein